MTTRMGQVQGASQIGTASADLPLALVSSTLAGMRGQPDKTGRPSLAQRTQLRSKHGDGRGCQCPDARKLRQAFDDAVQS